MPSGSEPGFLEILWQVIIFGWWIFLPIGLYSIFRPLWEKYVSGVYARESLNTILLKIKIPQDQSANPKAMESVLIGLTGTGRTITLYNAITTGAFQDYFSLEIASREGETSFYIATPKRSEDLVKKLFYSQFPDIEIMEAPEDYTKAIPDTIPDENWGLWGGKYILEKNQAQPINTYPSFEDKFTGEMVDPLSGLLEAMGSLGPGEHLWFQIQIGLPPAEWRKEGKKEIEKILKKYNLMPASESSEEVMMRVLPHHEQETIKAISYKMSKPAFSTQIIFAYIARQEVFNPILAANIGGAMKQFESGDLNAFMLDKYYTLSTYFLLAKGRKEYRARRLVDMLRDRDVQGVCPVLNVEELATLFHFPTKMMRVPSLPRLDNKRAPAPPNLPLEEK